MDGHVAALNANTMRRQEAAAAKQRNIVLNDATEIPEANRADAIDKRPDKNNDKRADKKVA